MNRSDNGIELIWHCAKEILMERIILMIWSRHVITIVPEEFSDDTLVFKLVSFPFKCPFKFPFKVPFSFKLVPFSIELVPFPIEVVPFSFKLVPFSIELVPFPIEVVPFSFKLVPFPFKLVPFSIELVPFPIEMGDLLSAPKICESRDDGAAWNTILLALTVPPSSLEEDFSTGKL